MQGTTHASSGSNAGSHTGSIPIQRIFLDPKYRWCRWNSQMSAQHDQNIHSAGSGSSHQRPGCHFKSGVGSDGLGDGVLTVSAYELEIRAEDAANTISKRAWGAHTHLSAGLGLAFAHSSTRMTRIHISNARLNENGVQHAVMAFYSRDCLPLLNNFTWTWGPPLGNR